MSSLFFCDHCFCEFCDAIVTSVMCFRCACGFPFQLLSLFTHITLPEAVKKMKGKASAKEKRKRVKEDGVKVLRARA